jgi:hypothetical protein
MEDTLLNAPPKVFGTLHPNPEMRISFRVFSVRMRSKSGAGAPSSSTGIFGANSSATGCSRQWSQGCDFPLYTDI